MANIPKIIYIALSIMLANLPMAMAADIREAYRPAGQAFSQIIQDDDYAIIAKYKNDNERVASAAKR